MFKVMSRSILVGLCMLFLACQHRFSGFQQAVASIDYKNVNIENIRFIIVIPEAGCAGCISYVEEFYLNNKNNESLFFVFSNIVSLKMLKSKLQLNESNTYLDLDNRFMDCYPSEQALYPCVLDVQHGIIRNIYYQSPKEDGLSIVQQKMNI